MHHISHYIKCLEFTKNKTERELTFRRVKLNYIGKVFITVAST